MRIVLQRVKEASVAIDGQLYNEIEGGYLLLVGITEGDTEETAEKMAAKVHDLRIFEDENGKMNLAIEQIGGQVLSISQSARPALARPLYDHFNEALRRQGLVVKPGTFGAEMKVRLLNDGPVTLILDSSELF